MGIDKKRMLFAILWGLVGILSACSSDKNTEEEKVVDAVRDAGSDAEPDANTSANGCTRETLKATVDSYFEALTAHDHADLPLASKVRFTENGKELQIGEGLWTTAGELRFKRSAFDTESCNSVTESTIAEEDTDIIFGFRLRLEENQIVEIETVVVRSGDYISYPAGLVETANDDWETLLAVGNRPTREELAAIVDRYFLLFPQGACGFAEDCTRYENGLPTGACTNSLFCADAGSAAGERSMTPRLHVLDVEAGIAVGFTMFSSRTFPGLYTDFHMFKLRDGKVHSLHATLASATQSGWE